MRVALYIVLLASAFVSCKQATTGPTTTSGPDTTSHSFTWTIETFGDGGSSVLYDVAIINDTLAYAVGAVYMRDIVGNPDPLPYNVAKWDGVSWKLNRVTVQTTWGLVTAPLYGISAVSATDIWLTSGVPIHGDGESWTQFHLFEMGVLTPNDGALTNIWAKNSSDIYLAGEKGTLVHYDTGHWQKLSSGTTVDLRDIAGSADGQFVWASGYSINYTNSVLLALDGGLWHTAWTRQGGGTPPFGDLLSSVWVFGTTLYAATNLGIYAQSTSGPVSSATMMLPVDAFPYRVRGSGQNNIVAVGDQGKIWHYNGSTWKQLILPDPNRRFHSVAVSKNLIIAVGNDYNTFPTRALICFGKR